MIATAAPAQGVAASGRGADVSQGETSIVPAESHAVAGGAPGLVGESVAAATAVVDRPLPPSPTTSGGPPSSPSYGSASTPGPVQPRQGWLQTHRAEVALGITAIAGGAARLLARRRRS